MSIFEDTFTVTAVDPDGKVFERGNNSVCWLFVYNCAVEFPLSSP